MSDTFRVSTVYLVSHKGGLSPLGHPLPGPHFSKPSYSQPDRPTSPASRPAAGGTDRDSDVGEIDMDDDAGSESAASDSEATAGDKPASDAQNAPGGNGQSRRKKKTRTVFTRSQVSCAMATATATATAAAQRTRLKRDDATQKKISGT